MRMKRPADSRNRFSCKGRLVLQTGAAALLVFALTLLTFAPSFKNGFVWDDAQYVVENQRIRSLNLHALTGACTTYYQSNWHPLTWISHAVDYHFFGLMPSGHHVSSVIIHALNGLLVFFLVIKLVVVAGAGKNNGEQPPALISYGVLSGAITALFFSLHPLRVESVAWVAERKDLLCAFFFLCSVLSYLHYHAPPSAGNRRVWFVCTTVFFLLALAAKPMAVTLPAVLLLLDWYPLARARSTQGEKGRMLLEKVPLFLISGASIVATIAAQSYGRTIRSLEQMPADARILNAVRSLFFYVEKTIVPINLAPFYPFPRQSHWLDFHHGLSFLFIAVIIGLSLWWAGRRNYLLPVAWTYYGVTLSPVLGIIQVGGQSAADRYAYLPTIPVFMLMGTGIAWILLRKPVGLHRGIRTALTLILAGCLCMLMLASRRQISVWRDSESLWTRVVTIFPFPESDPLVHYNLGNAYLQNGKQDQAIIEFNRTLRLQPRHARAYNNLGKIYVEQGRLDEAIAAFKHAVAINPGNAKAYNNLGSAYLMEGDVENAIGAIQRSLALNPANANAHSNLAIAYYAKKEYDLARRHYAEALKQGGGVNPQLSQLFQSLP